MQGQGYSNLMDFRISQIQPALQADLLGTTSPAALWEPCYLAAGESDGDGTINISAYLQKMTHPVSFWNIWSPLAKKRTQNQLLTAKGGTWAAPFFFFYLNLGWEDLHNRWNHYINSLPVFTSNFNRVFKTHLKEKHESISLLCRSTFFPFP